ncbi:hypothetical protein KXD93_24695 [Mucilaginibacter sp. BJC16-A38]|uniref:DUF6527 family protein n=1 Tax=Mucilaginibacter phenanthrenivorans TaxID=1234842 RepID=UPI00215728C0|nr:DUF6527 family protein [Mucilaginibacter phenanthrenivorans]MCR8560879.1 hypothetical protein [Mucilaginibacter phenanthrenivorans]
MSKFRIRCWNKVLFLLHEIDIGYEIVSARPDPAKITVKWITFVGTKGLLKWALLKCPCGCGEVLNLSLMKNYEPNWVVKFDSKSRVTLSPSVWKNDGCRSHFFIRKGKVIWATA